MITAIRLRAQRRPVCPPFGARYGIDSGCGEYPQPISSRLVSPAKHGRGTLREVGLRALCGAQRWCQTSQPADWTGRSCQLDIDGPANTAPRGLHSPATTQALR